MSGSGDLKTHMDKSSIKELKKYINDGDTPPNCNNIYTIAQAIQYMDDTYLREFTDEKLRYMKQDKPKTPVPYNEWIKCMVGEFKPDETANTAHKNLTGHDPRETSGAKHEEDAKNAENESKFCVNKDCRTSKSLGSCLPKNRMLNSGISADNKEKLKSLYYAIVREDIANDPIKSIIATLKTEREEAMQQYFDNRGGRKTRKRKRRASTKKHKKRASTKKHKKYKKRKSTRKR